MAPVEGYWGKQTATIDWCEENYVVSYYIAEFWNTVSNAVMIFAPLAMVFVGLKENHEKRFLYSFSAITVVGMGSWLFHMTLQYSMQLMDELPMIWGSSFLVYSLYMIKSKPDEECIPLQVFLVVYCVLVTLVYVLINAPVFHEVSYALMVISMVLIALRIVQLSSSTLEVTRRPNPDKRTFVLSCGQVESLGEPPADIVWKASNGTRLPTSFQDGYLMLTLDVNEDYGEYTCQLDWESPAAKCIPEEEKDMWTGSISLSSSSSSPDMTMIIVAVVVAVVVVIVVVVVIMIWVKRCRGKGNTYNAKEHEAKVTMANRSNADPLLEDPEAKPTSPIYKGPPTDRVDTANPYMVSNIRPYSSEVDAGSRKPLAPKASHEDSKVNGGKTPAGEEKKKQPKAKPRSIFLTPSMEALDAIGKSDGRDDPGTAV